MAAEDRSSKIPGPAPGLPESHAKPSSAPESPIAPPPSANALPAGAGLNTAGGKVREAGLFDAVRSIKFNDFREVHEKPCVRDALLTGIGAGFGIGGARAIWRGNDHLHNTWPKGVG